MLIKAANSNDITLKNDEISKQVVTGDPKEPCQKQSQAPLQGLMILRLFHQPPNYRDKATVDGFPWISQKESYGQIPGEVRLFF